MSDKPIIQFDLPTPVQFWARRFSGEIELIGEVRDRVVTSLAVEMRALTQRYQEMEAAEGEPNDAAYEWLADEGHFRSVHVEQTMTNAFVIAYYSQLEYALEALCRYVQSHEKCPLSAKETNGSSTLERCIRYLEKVGGLNLQKRESDLWATILLYRALRNSIAHESSTEASSDLKNRAKGLPNEVTIDLDGAITLADGFLGRMQLNLHRFLGEIKNALPSNATADEPKERLR